MNDSLSSTMTRHCFFPGLVTARFTETWAFYTERLGFSTLVEASQYVQLTHPCGAQLAILRHEVDGDLPELISATDGRGVWFHLEVEDADAEFERLLVAGVPIAQPPENRPWGERAFVARDPNGILVFIGHRLTEAVAPDRAAASA
jgi:catechol 2,3-dioxygenase-like lactoylglutathione lyase family enzyme